MNTLQRLVVRVGRGLGLYVLSRHDYKTLEEYKRLAKLLKRIAASGENARFKEFASARLVASHSQSLQDLFALFCHPNEPGFFVEFGASDGTSINNTLLMEQDHGWSGIISEPARVFHARISSSRTCSIDFRCVSSRSGNVVTFAEDHNPDQSGIQDPLGQTHQPASARTARMYDVETVSLEDLLTQYNAPKRINFLSIDTEGSEFDILSNFDFSSFAIDTLTVEHNFRPDREAIHELLTSKGFRRVEEDLSEQDDWYVSADTFDSHWVE
jgi:FkbM family methyltransferase